jgi:hypothetical protein
VQHPSGCVAAGPTAKASAGKRARPAAKCPPNLQNAGETRLLSATFDLFPSADACVIHTDGQSVLKIN